MALTISCLQKDTNLMDVLKDAVEKLVWHGLEHEDLDDQKRAVHLSTIWAQLRSAGVEIDLETTAHVYQEVAPKGFDAIMKTKSLEAYALKMYNRAIRRAAQMRVATKVDKTGEQRPERKLVTGIMNMLKNTYAPDKRTKTDMKEMEDIAWKAVQRLLNVPKAQKPQTNDQWTDVLEKVMDRNNLGINDINGRLNSLQDLFNSMRDVLDETKGTLAEEIRRRNGDPATIQRFNQMIDGLNANAMTLFFSRSEAKQMLYDMFKREGFGKQVGSRTILDWNKLAGTTSKLADLRGHVDDIMNRNGYSQDVIEAVKDSMVNELNKLHGDIINRQINGQGQITDQGKAIASEAANELVENFLQGKDFKDWLEENHVENLEQLDQQLNQALAQTKYEPAVKDQIRDNLRQRFFDRAYTKLANREARQALRDVGIHATNPRSSVPDEVEVKIRRAVTDPAVMAELRRLSGQTDIKDKNGNGILKAYHDAVTSGQNQPLVDYVNNLPGKMQSPLQWIKQNSIENVGQLQTALNQKLAGTNLSQPVKDMIQKEFERVMDADKIADNELRRRRELGQRQKEKRKTNLRLSKSEVDRLVEMGNLGVFEKGYRDLVNKLLGVSDLQAQDEQDIEDIANEMGRIYRAARENLSLNNPDIGIGAQMFVGTPMNELQGHLNRIMANNVNNKTKRLERLSTAKTLSDGMLVGLLGTWSGILRNLTNNTMSTIGRMLSSKENISGAVQKQNVRLAWAVFKDLLQNGETYAGRINDFTPSVHFLDSIEFPQSWREALPQGFSKEELGKLGKLLKLAIFGPGKLGLAALDSINLVVGHHMQFNNAALTALTHPKGANLSKQDALLEMNQAFNQQSWDDARDMARTILTDSYARLPEHLRREVTNARVERFAWDLIQANLSTNGALTADQVKAASNSALNTASYGLGHTANNSISKIVQNNREKFRRDEKRLIREATQAATTAAQQDKWDQLADLRRRNIMNETFGFRFIGGSTNWLYMQFQKMAFGVPALYTWATGAASKKKLNFDDPKEMQRTLTEMQKARDRMSRGLIGASSQIASYLLFGLMAAAHGDDKDKDKLDKLLAEIERKKQQKEKSSGIIRSMLTAQINKLEADLKELGPKGDLATAIREDPMAQKLFNIFCADDMLLAMYIDSYTKGGKSSMYGALKYVQQTTGLKYTTATRLADAVEAAKHGDSDAAWGIVGQVVGDRLTVPGWKSAHDNFQLVKYPFTKDLSQNYSKPNSFLQGAFGGGAIEAFGLYRPDPRITAITGIGSKSFAEFKAKGITDISDLRKHPGWEKMRGADGRPILNKKQQRDAKAYYDDYAEQKWGDQPKK